MVLSDLPRRLRTSRLPHPASPNFRLKPSAAAATISAGSAIVAVVSTLLNLFISTRPPDSQLTTSPILRVSQKPGQPAFYVQTAFYHTGQNDRPEIITSMKLKVRRDTEPLPICFEWRENAAFQSDPTQGSTPNYRHVSEPVPIVITRGTVQTPLALFQGPSSWAFQAGVPYHVTLEAQRTVNQSSPLRSAFRFTLDEQAMQTINATDRFLYWRTNVQPDDVSTLPCQP